MPATALTLRALRVLPLVLLLLVCGGTGVAHADGTWAWPLQPTPSVVRPFDPPSKVWLPGHRGVDLRGQPGQAVLAPVGGRVAFAAPLAGRGVVVVETTAGLRATLEPVAAAVDVGDRVQRGQVVGHLQLAGSHCLPAGCLHWGVKRGADTYLDPLALVGRPEIVLLPLRDSPSTSAWPPWPTAPGAPASPAWSVSPAAWPTWSGSSAASSVSPAAWPGSPAGWSDGHAARPGAAAPAW